MAIPKSKAPSWTDAFRNILKLEESHGFNDTAVMGGLGKFIQRWSSDMAALADVSGDAHFLLNEPYVAMSPEVRARWVLQWRQTIGETVGGGVGDTGETVAPENEASPPGPVKRSKTHKAPPAGLNVDAPVDRLRGVDTKLTARLQRLDVESVRDLLYLFPRRHEDYSNIVSINSLTPGEDCTVVGTVWEARDIAKGPKGRRHDTEAVLSDDTGNIRVIWFGQRYLAKTLKPGSKLAISGKPSVFRGQLVFESPE